MLYAVPFSPGGRCWVRLGLFVRIDVIVVWSIGACVAARSKQTEAVRSSMCLSGWAMWFLYALMNCLWAAFAMRLKRVLSVNMSVPGGG